MLTDALAVVERELVRSAHTWRPILCKLELVFLLLNKRTLPVLSHLTAGCSFFLYASECKLASVCEDKLLSLGGKSTAV